jgi:rhodanese-related sulfurtransferase
MLEKYEVLLDNDVLVDVRVDAEVCVGFILTSTPIPSGTNPNNNNSLITNKHELLLIHISSTLIMGFPEKYFRGLSSRKKTQRRREIRKFGSISWKNPKAYVGFSTDKGIKTRRSNYTERWYKKYPHAKSLEEKSKVSGVPLKDIKEVYNRGMAAWRTGHRPGATQQQWGYARVHSFLLHGKTYHTTDSDIARRV